MPARALVSQPRSPQARDEFFLRSVAFHGVASPAHKLKVVDVVGSALRARDYVVNGEIAEWEQNLASRADAFLTSEQRSLVSFIARKRAGV